MTDTVIPNRFLVRGGTAAAIASLNEVPKAREIVFETDSLRFKLGNGSTNYNSLSYVNDRIFDFGASGSGVEVRSNATVTADYRWLTGTNYRWIARKSGDAESGANAGSNFEFQARADDGSFLGHVYTIARATRVFDFKVAPTLNGVALVPTAYTNEDAQDAIAAMIAAGTHTGITITYSDVGNSMSFVVTGGGGGSGSTFSVTQASHGFVIGSPIVFKAGVWQLADRDDATTCADAIVYSVTSVNAFTYVVVGEMTATEAEWDVKTGDTSTSDPYFATNVSLLLHGNGTNGSTTFTDSSPSPKTMTAGGNAQLSTAAVKYGSASMLFDGAGDYLSTPVNTAFQFGTGDFTLEAWVRPVSLAAAGDIFAHRNSSDANNFWGCRLSTGGFFGVYSKTGGSDQTSITTTSNPLTVGTWYHVAVVRYLGVVNVYVNGALCTKTVTIDNGAAWAYPNVPLLIAAGDNVSSYYNGYLDDVRFTKGLARYTGAFTAPTAQLPDASTTGLGLTASEYYYLSSTTGGITATAPTTGNAQILGKALSATKFLAFVSPPVAVFGTGGGALTLVGTATVTTATATSITLTGLDLTVDGRYFIEYAFKNASASNVDIRLFWNGDTTTTNYYNQNLLGFGSSTFAARANAATITGIGSASGTANGHLWVSFDRDGRARSTGKSTRDAASTVNVHDIAQVWNTVANPTSATMSASVASALTLGDYFKVWKLS